jgi:hypothetical protein
VIAGALPEHFISRRLMTFLSGGVLHIRMASLPPVWREVSHLPPLLLHMIDGFRQRSSSARATCPPADA